MVDTTNYSLSSAPRPEQSIFETSPGWNCVSVGKGIQLQFCRFGCFINSFVSQLHPIQVPPPGFQPAGIIYAIAGFQILYQKLNVINYYFFKDIVFQQMLLILNSISIELRLKNRVLGIHS